MGYVPVPSPERTNVPVAGVAALLAGLQGNSFIPGNVKLNPLPVLFADIKPKDGEL
jgi:hypothetical protein